MMDAILQAIGWGGSALLVISLLQSRMLTLRILNLIAAVVLAGYNAAIAVWPSVAMNAVVAGIDLFYLIAWRGLASRLSSHDPLATDGAPTTKAAARARRG